MLNSHAPNSAVVIAKLLDCEGFSEHTASMVRRYWRRSIMDERRAKRIGNIKKAFSKLVKAKLDEADRIVLGRFISVLERMAFDTGLRMGLIAFLHDKGVESCSNDCASGTSKSTKISP